jgi:hypothetical protein
MVVKVWSLLGVLMAKDIRKEDFQGSYCLANFQQMDLNANCMS